MHTATLSAKHLAARRARRIDRLTVRLAAADRAVTWYQYEAERITANLGQAGYDFYLTERRATRAAIQAELDVWTAADA